MRQSVQRLSPIRLVFIAVYEDFFQKIQLYSVVRMNEASPLANATTTESLLELGSVLDATGTKNFPQDQIKHVRKSMAARCQHTQSPSLGLEIPQNHLNVMQN